MSPSLSLRAPKGAANAVGGGDFDRNRSQRIEKEVGATGVWASPPCTAVYATRPSRAPRGVASSLITVLPELRSYGHSCTSHPVSEKKANSFSRGLWHGNRQWRTRRYVSTYQERCEHKRVRAQWRVRARGGEGGARQCAWYPAVYLKKGIIRTCSGQKSKL